MLRQESRRTRLRRIKRYGNKAFQSARRTPMTFETIPSGDQTDDVSSASDQMRIFLLICKQMATLPSTIDVTESHWKVISNYWTKASETNRPTVSHALVGTM
nr:unnamed protein product [Spirometra erinaceieuropaei]VZI44115.1 unnamed protein product [Spirometra erinaceieuropaei]